MHKKSEHDFFYEDETSWHFYKHVLNGENDCKACIHFIKSEAALLARLGTECIKVESEGSRELFFFSATARFNCK